MTFTVLFPQKITARITGIYRNYNHFYDTGPLPKLVLLLFLA
jgi:hypothetical protein